MNLENAKNVRLEGQRTIGLKTQDVDKLSANQVSSSSFSVDSSVVQGEVSGGQVPEDHTINTSVIDNGVQLPVEQPQTMGIPSVETVSSVPMPELTSEPVEEIQSNIFDVPQESYQPTFLQPEVVPEPVPSVSVPEYNGVESSSFEVQPQVSEVNMYDAPTVSPQPEVQSFYVSQEPVMPETSVYQAPEQQNIEQDNFYVQPQVNAGMPLDTPQTFYEKQADQEAQGGFTDIPGGEVKSDIPNVNTDPVLIMLDEVMHTVSDRNKIASSLENEVQVLRNENTLLRNENESLKQQMIELNNKVLIAEAQRQAAEQTLAGARMAESGMMNNAQAQARVYQPQQMPQPNYYQQAA